MPLERVNALAGCSPPLAASKTTSTPEPDASLLEGHLYQIAPSTSALNRTTWQEALVKPILAFYHYLSPPYAVKPQDDPELAVILDQGAALLTQSEQLHSQMRVSTTQVTHTRKGGAGEKWQLILAMLLLGCVPGVMGVRVAGRKHGGSSDDFPFSDHESKTGLNGASMPLFSQENPGRLLWLETPLADRADLGEYLQICKANINHELVRLFNQTTLPVGNKYNIITRVYHEYLTLKKMAYKPNESERLRHLDMILLDMGLEPGPYQMCYRELGTTVRKRLTSFSQYANVKQYLKENLPHQKISRSHPTEQKQLTDYHRASLQHEIQRTDFFNSNSTRLDHLITKIYCERFATPDENPCSLALNMKHDVEFIWKYLIIIFRPYVTESFTTKELFLGVYKRVALEKGYVDIHFPPGTDSTILKALDPRPNITDYIDDELRALFLTLKQDEKTRALFESTLLFRARGIVINSLERLQQGGLAKTLRRFLDNQLQPLLVTLQGNPIPNLLALSSPMESHVLLISLAHSDVRVFEKNKWNTELQVFIAKHLSLFDSNRVVTGGLQIGKLCSMGLSLTKKTGIGCYYADLGYAYSDNYASDMYDAILAAIEKNIDYITYTHQEYTEENRLFILKRTLFMASALTGVLTAGATAPYWAALMITMGLGIGIGEIYVNQLIAEGTDDGAIYERALFEANLGKWSLISGVLDYTLDATLLIKRFKSSAKMLHPTLNHFSATSPLISKKLKKLIRPSMYDKRVDASLLSFPDRHGLQWSVDNVSYLKVKNNYVKAVRNPNSNLYEIGDASLLASLSSNGRLIPFKAARRGGMFSKRKRYLYKASPEFRKIKVRGAGKVGKVGYRTLGDNHYALFYTQLTDIEQQGSHTLVVSAHGGFYPGDVKRPAVLLPEDMTIKLLNPHGTALNDPGLNNLVNGHDQVESYLTLWKQGYRVNSVPQSQQFWNINKVSNLESRLSALGRRDGLQNYRHLHFEDESPALVANVVVNNRKLAQQGQAPLTDVMVVNDKIVFVPDTDMELASIQRVIDLDAEGALRNAAGERYNTIIFAHCRNDFTQTEAKIPLYMAGYPNLPGLSRDAIKMPIIRTILTRQAVNAPFTVQREEIGKMTFFPISSLPHLNATLSSLV